MMPILSSLVIGISSCKLQLKTILKKRSEKRKHCMLAVVNVCPAANLLPGGAVWPKFNQLEMVTTFTYKASLVRIDARNFELSW